MAHDKTVYLALPISGRSYDSVIRDIEEVRKDLFAYFEVLHPMTGKGHLRNEIEFKAHGYNGFPTSTNHAIFERDRWMVGQADIVLFNFLEDNGRVSIGSMFELAWASELKKLTVVVMSENSIHRHAFVLEAADMVFENMEDALIAIRKLAGG